MLDLPLASAPIFGLIMEFGLVLQGVAEEVRASGEAQGPYRPRQGLPAQGGFHQGIASVRSQVGTLVYHFFSSPVSCDVPL